MIGIEIVCLMGCDNMQSDGVTSKKSLVLVFIAMRTSNLVTLCKKVKQISLH